MLSLADAGSQSFLAPSAECRSPSSPSESDTSPSAAVSPSPEEWYTAEQVERVRLFSANVFDKVKREGEERQASHEAQLAKLNAMLAENDAEIHSLRGQLQAANESLADASMALVDAESEAMLNGLVPPNDKDDDISSALNDLGIRHPDHDALPLDMVGVDNLSTFPRFTSLADDASPTTPSSMVSPMPFGRHSSLEHDIPSRSRSVATPSIERLSVPRPASAATKNGKRNWRRRNKALRKPGKFNPTLFASTAPGLALGGILTPISSVNATAAPLDSEFGHFH